MDSRRLAYLKALQIDFWQQRAPAAAGVATDSPPQPVPCFHALSGPSEGRLHRRFGKGAHLSGRHLDGRHGQRLPGDDPQELPLAVASETAEKGVGGGSGAFAEVALKRLTELDALPDRYAILETSADLRQRQRERLQQHLPPPLFDLVEWLDGPLSHEWDGVLFANEVIDALPTPRFAIHAGEVFEEYVTFEGDRFARTLRPADAFLSTAVRNLERALDRAFAEGYRSEVLPQLPYWIQAVSGGMRRGAMLFVDYCHPRGEYYLPERGHGTLRAYYRHRMHERTSRAYGGPDRRR